MLSVKSHLPLVPDPLPGEHLLSWIGRLAARYGMAAREFLTAIAKQSHAVPCSAPTELDEFNVEPFLGELSRRSGIQLQVLQRSLPMVQNLAWKGLGSHPEQMAWYRGWVAWCPVCVQEDISARGEVFGRADWYSRHCVICLQHRRLLTDHCPRCMRQTVGPMPASGRLRLICRSCAIPVDSHRVAEHVALDSLSVLYLSSAACERLAEFQVDLTRAVSGVECYGPWRYGSSPAEFLDAAADLCMAFAGPPLTHRQNSQPLYGLGVSDGAAGFAAAASVLASLNGVDIGVRYTSHSPILSSFPLRLGELLKHLSYAERVWLRLRRMKKHDRLWCELSCACAPFVPSGGFTGESMTPQSVLFLTNLRGKEFIKDKPTFSGRQRQCQMILESPHMMVEGLMFALGKELVSHDVPQFGRKRTVSLTRRRSADAVERHVTALIAYTQSQIGDKLIHTVLHQPSMQRSLSPSGRFPEGHELIYYLQGRRRRSLCAALVRLSLLNAWQPSEINDPQLDADEVYLRSLS